MKRLSDLVLDYVAVGGACAVGIVSTETLAGGPPSADLTRVSASAKAAVVFALPMDQSQMAPFLGKKDRRAHERNNIAVNLMASGMALELSNFLSQRGYPSVPVAANQVYRRDSPRGLFDLIPEISLRYLAVRSGVGFFGLSGNVITKNEGAGVILGAVVTDAALVPTEPLPEKENYCDGCRLCLASCLSGLMDGDEMTRVTLGGRTFSYAKRRSYNRCEYVCGGFTGLHPSGQWSTWSPGRFPIPEEDAGFMPAMIRAIRISSRWPAAEGGLYHVVMKDKMYLTCGNCQLICHPDRKERTRRYKLLTRSGAVVKNPDGSLEALPPEAARRRLSSLSPEARALYEDPDVA